MSEKEKNKAQKHTLKSVFMRLALPILIISMFCCGIYYPELGIKDFFAIRDCSKSTELFEWDGMFNSANAPQSEILITEENTAQISFLGMFSDSVPDYYTADYRGLKHPQHIYSLRFAFLGYGTTHLKVCQPENNFASHVLGENIQSYNFSPDGRFFAVANGRRSEILIYDANTLEVYGRIGFGTQADDRYTLGVYEIAFHPTEPLIAFMLFDHPTISSTVQFWNYETLSFVSQGISHEGSVTFMAFNPEGTVLFIQVDHNDILAYGIPSE